MARAGELLFELQPRQLISEIDYRGLSALTEVCGEHLGHELQGVFKAGLGAQGTAEHDGPAAELHPLQDVVRVVGVLGQAGLHGVERVGPGGGRDALRLASGCRQEGGHQEACSKAFS